MFAHTLKNYTEEIIEEIKKYLETNESMAI